MLKAMPLSLADARVYVDTVHRHHDPVIRDKFRVAAGELDRKKFNECYSSWKAHARFGDCEGIVANLDRQIVEILGS